MPRATGRLCCSSHIRQAAAAQLIAVEHRDGAMVEPDVAEVREAAQSAVYVLAGGANHGRQGLLVEGRLDGDSVRCWTTVGIGKLDQLGCNATRYIEEGHVAERGVFPPDVCAQARDQPHQKIWPRS